MGTENTEGPSSEATISGQDSKEDQVVDLFAERVKRMSDNDVREECIMYLRVLEKELLTPAHKIRAITLFTQASQRATMEVSHNDFKVALRVLKLL